MPPLAGAVGAVHVAAALRRHEREFAISFSFSAKTAHCSAPVVLHSLNHPSLLLPIALQAFQIITHVQSHVLTHGSGSGLVIPAPQDLPAGLFPSYRDLCDLMQACWAKEPAERPTFAQIVQRLRSVCRAMLGLQAATCHRASCLSRPPSQTLAPPTPRELPPALPPHAEPC